MKTNGRILDFFLPLLCSFTPQHHHNAGPRKANPSRGTIGLGKNETSRSSDDNNEESATNREATLVVDHPVQPNGTEDEQKEKKKKNDSVYSYYVVSLAHLDLEPSVAQVRLPMV